MPASRHRLGFLDRIARSLVHRQLSSICNGEIIIRENGAEYYFGQYTDKVPLRVKIEVLHPSIWQDVAFGGTSGSGEAYMKGSWRCDNLTALVRIFLSNRDALDKMDQSLMRLKAPVHKLIHWLRRNTRTGSRKNIGAHYDLGNDFFELFLDPSMMYSSAYYESPESSLEEASIAKMERICRKLALKPGDHLSLIHI